MIQKKENKYRKTYHFICGKHQQIYGNLYNDNKSWSEQKLTGEDDMMCQN